MDGHETPCWSVKPRFSLIPLFWVVTLCFWITCFSHRRIVRWQKEMILCQRESDRPKRSWQTKTGFGFAKRQRRNANTVFYAYTPVTYQAFSHVQHVGVRSCLSGCLPPAFFLFWRTKTAVGHLIPYTRCFHRIILKNNENSECLKMSWFLCFAVGWAWNKQKKHALVFRTWFPWLSIGKTPGAVRWCPRDVRLCRCYTIVTG